MTHPFPLFRLPDDLLGVILANLSVTDLASCAQVSRRMYRAANLNSVWDRKIRESWLLSTPDVRQSQENNFADLKKHLFFRRWASYRSWCNPEALGMRESEMQQLHEFLNHAIKALDVTHVNFRGKRYELVRQEEPSFIYIWSRPRARIEVKTDDYFISYHLPVHRPSHPAHFYADNDGGDDAETVPKTIVRRRNVRKGASREHTRCPAAAIVGGVVLRIPPCPLPLVPAPEARVESGYSKLLYRVAYCKFYQLCPLCARNGSSDCNGDIPPFCRRCWLSRDLNLYMSAEQAREEYCMEVSDLAEARQRYRIEKKATRRQHHVKTALCNSPLNTGMVTSGTQEPSADNTAFFREFDVAYLALLKWGSSAAIARRIAQRPAPAAPAKLVEDLQLLDVEMCDRQLLTKRKRRGAEKEDNSDADADEDFVPRGAAAKCRAKAQATAKKRSPRKVAQGKVYVPPRDTYDTRIAEANTADLLRWGVTFATGASGRM